MRRLTIAIEHFVFVIAEEILAPRLNASMRPRPSMTMIPSAVRLRIASRRPARATAVAGEADAEAVF